MDDDIAVGRSTSVALVKLNW